MFAVLVVAACIAVNAALAALEIAFVSASKADSRAPPLLAMPASESHSTPNGELSRQPAALMPTGCSVCTACRPMRTCTERVEPSEGNATSEPS